MDHSLEIVAVPSPPTSEVIATPSWSSPEDSEIVSDDPALSGKDVSLDETHHLQSKDVCPVDITAGESSDYYGFLLAENIKFITAPTVAYANGVWLFTQQFSLAEDLLNEIDLLVHWGFDRWIDQEVRDREIFRLGTGVFEVRVELAISKPGKFGATLYAKHALSSLRIWQGDPQLDDANFEILPGDPALRAAEIGFSGKALHKDFPVGTYEDFARAVTLARGNAEHRAIGRRLFQLTREDPALREKLSEYLNTAKEVLASSHSAKDRKLANEVLSVLHRIGIGEVVLVSPEGPHAAAGGLSQVISGLLLSLSGHAVQTTLISPLYEDENGKKHTSADYIIKNGIHFGGRVLKVKERGEIELNFPETKNGTETVRFETKLFVRVYLAEAENLRMFFLRHRRLADSLYRNVWGDEQIKRAIFLSRGALEIVGNPEFGVTPHLMISNDWMTGLVPALMQTDPQYRDNPALREAQTVHVIHNGGVGYQGKFSSTHFGEDLFPLMGISGEHYFGLTDPRDRKVFNFTAGAVFHVRNAILTVSRPYAAELLTADGGEGLESLYRRRRRILFGISNGIDRVAIRKTIWELAFIAIQREKRAHTFRDALYVDRLPNLKNILKAVVQHRYSLKLDANAKLVCLVGRLAEQKGIKLLTDEVSEGETVLSVLLNENPDLQILICGPKTTGDAASELLGEHVQILAKAYPGRIAGQFEFVPHREAIEVVAAGDLFLMPSRYEPGGLTQLEALAVGTPVVARNIGGIQATLKNVSEDGTEGNSFLFERYSAAAFLDAIERGLEVLAEPKSRTNLLKRAARAEHDWSNRLPSYMALFRFIAGASDPFHRYPYLEDERALLDAMRASAV